MTHRRNGGLIALVVVGLAVAVMVFLLFDASEGAGPASHGALAAPQIAEPASPRPSPPSGVSELDSETTEPVPLAVTEPAASGVVPTESPGPEFLLSLRIVDGAGQALREAVVQWAPGRRRDDERPWTPVDENGGWRVAIPLAEVPEGFRIRARATGFSEGQLWVAQALEASFDLGELALARAPRVAGVVRDASGRPVVGASVSAWARSPGERSRLINEVITTDAAGAFSLDLARVRPDLASFVLAWHEVHGGPAEARFVLDETGQVSDLDVVLQQGVPVSGRVVDERGDPIRDATVRAVLSRDVVAQTLSDVEGEFALNLHRIEGLRLGAEAEGYIVDSEEPLETFGDSLDDIVLPLWPRCDVTLRATDAHSGEPIPEFDVWVHIRIEAHSYGTQFHGAGGVAELNGVYCGTWRPLDVSAPGYWPASFPEHERWPDNNDGVIEVLMEPREIISPLPGRVLDAALVPVANAEVFALATSTYRSDPLARTLTNENGEYAELELTEGEYRLYARAAKGASTLPLAFTLEADSGRYPDLVLRDGATLRGRLVRDDGLPVGAMLLTLEPRRRGEAVVDRPGLITDDDGRFVFEHLPAGDWMPRLTRAGRYANPELELESFGLRLESGETREVEMSLSVSRRLHVRLIPRPDGDTSEWTARLTRTAESSTNIDWELNVLMPLADPDALDADGRVVLGPVSPGVFTLTITDESGEARASTDFVVGPSMSPVQEVDVPLR